MHQKSIARTIVRRAFSRAERRIELLRKAVLVTSDNQHCDALVLDISAGGFRIRVDEALSPGESVTLRVDRKEELLGRIRWVLGNEAGGTLVTPTQHFPR